MVSSKVFSRLFLYETFLTNFFNDSRNFNSGLIKKGLNDCLMHRCTLWRHPIHRKTIQVSERPFTNQIRLSIKVLHTRTMPDVTRLLQLNPVYSGKYLWFLFWDSPLSFSVKGWGFRRKSSDVTSVSVAWVTVAYSSSTVQLVPHWYHTDTAWFLTALPISCKTWF